MTPTPASGDIWEWTHNADPALFLLINTIDLLNNWSALNLTAGIVEDISIHSANIHNWRKLA